MGQATLRAIGVWAAPDQAGCSARSGTGRMSRVWVRLRLGEGMGVRRWCRSRGGWDEGVVGSVADDLPACVVDEEVVVFAEEYPVGEVGWVRLGSIR